MSFRARVERIDADYFIPRPADEPDLDSFHAATRFFQDLSRGGTLLLSSIVAGYLFFKSGLLINLSFKWMVFVLIHAWIGAVGEHRRSQGKGLGSSIERTPASWRSKDWQTQFSVESSSIRSDLKIGESLGPHRSVWTFELGKISYVLHEYPPRLGSVGLSLSHGYQG
jgi:hypothetical protein